MVKLQEGEFIQPFTIRSPSLPASLDRLKAQSSEGYKYKNVKIRLRRLNNLYDIF